jgi:Tfp pilus assembly protein FimT
MASRRHGSSRGATLLDALIAASIMVVLYAVGVPNLSRLRSPYTLTGATRQIAADLQAARQRAIARNVSYRVNFDTQNGRYTIERAQAGGWVAESAPQPLPSGARLGTVLPGNPVFDPRGMLGAEVTVPVTVSGSGTRTVTINVLGKTTIT